MATNIYKGAYGEEIIEFTGDTSATGATTHASSTFTIRPGVHIHWMWDGPAALSSTSTGFYLEWSMDGNTWVGSYILQGHTTATNSAGVVDPQSTSGVSSGVLYRLTYSHNNAESTSYPFKGMIVVPNPNFNG